jgi:hypothetical protein
MKGRKLLCYDIMPNMFAFRFPVTQNVNNKYTHFSNTLLTQHFQLLLTSGMFRSFCETLIAFPGIVALTDRCYPSSHFSRPTHFSDFYYASAFPDSCHLCRHLPPVQTSAPCADICPLCRHLPAQSSAFPR